VTDFVTFARAHGIEIDPGRLYAGERIRRCGTTDKPRSTNGAYFWDGERGWVFNWAAEARVQWWNDPKAKAWTEAEKAAWKAKRQSMQASQDADYRRAAQRAAEMMRGATPGPHNYLHIKGFPDAQGLVTTDEALLIPMRNLRTNELQGVQVVRWVESERKYEKKMFPGMKAKGAIFRMGDKTAPETFLCEGYATGLSIHAALRSVGLRASVLVCFSAGNMVHVAPMVRGKCYVFADNDKTEAGEQAAQQTNLPYCMSPELGEDANDLHARAGLMAVCQQLMAVRRLEREMV
jgi:phage/plasmid primase-like uncharacterized protein